MYCIAKRFCDLLLSIIALFILSPIFLPIIILLRFTGEGHIFYYQKRIGYKGKYFNIIKFATMLQNSPNIGTGLITLRNDSRLLPMGKFLRKTKINELPQILNVIKGDMSIVGPRPLVDKTFNDYPENIRYKIYDSKPGITGIGSIIFRDEEYLLSNCKIPPQEYYEKVIAPYKGALEIWYNQHKSFFVDISIIFLTAWLIVFPKSNAARTVFKNLPAQKL